MTRLTENITETTAQEPQDKELQNILEHVGELTALQKQKLLEALKEEHKCVCDPEKFPQDLRDPCREAAIRIFNAAQQKAEEKKEKEKRKTVAARRIIKKMILQSAQRRKRKNHDAGAQRIAERMAAELVTMKELKIQDVVDIFERNLPDMRERCNVRRNPVTDNGADLEKLIELLEVRKPVKGYLNKLLIDASDLRELDLVKVWREKVAANGGHSREAKEARDKIEELGRTANTYCAAFFKPSTLHPEIEETNDLDALKRITARTVPLNVDSFRKLVSSIAKINMMHLVDTIGSQVKLGQMKAVSQHLEKLINARKHKLPDGREVFSCGNPEDAHRYNSVTVESVRVAAEKKEEAAARKYMDKGSENTRDFDVTNIKDWIRFRIMLTKKDSQDPQLTKKATIKVLSILCALLGTDVPQERLRYAFSSGETNTNSTGKHQAFHITLRYRYQCGASEIQTIPVEVQIQKYMDSKHAAVDHNDYVQKKDRKNTRIAGMDVTFYQFMTDLCDLVLSDYEPETVAELDENSRRRPLKEKMALILLMIITRKDKDGNLENSKFIREMYEDERQREKFEKLIQTYTEYIPYLMRKSGRERDAVNAPTLINQLALEAQQIMDDIGHQHSLRSFPGR